MITESRIQYEEILVVLTLISFVLLGSVALAGPPGPGYWAGKLYIFHEDSLDRLTEVETAKTEFGAKTMNLDPKTDNLCLTVLPPRSIPMRSERRFLESFRVLIYRR
jgi:hypothetical protein